MADDERPDPQVEQWLRVEPLDDVTRRRLVSTALREPCETTAPARRLCQKRATLISHSGLPKKCREIQARHVFRIRARRAMDTPQTYMGLRSGQLRRVRIPKTFRTVLN